ncbi:acetyl esterase/lipase [Paraburkholderia bannensis]|uniref:Acetyl esterase/lipase n=1 Tax=Paraburkholderia bannensis TaxID=765414 RepID=A0A7W9TU08_9BURK|nr:MULTISPECIES: alpha/beta hydrolase [Paraburkholderia]MBB3256317.1 acetyl esterase/lipase [Paraburkholderia sp. WP4_3_2]MBB6101317.1 acetyl esterase/lipase [Paraburkholderia bannensis]
MSLQSRFICWWLRRRFLPVTRRPIDVARTRVNTQKRVWLPPVPAGWQLREQYRDVDVPLRGEWLVREGGAPRTILYLHGGGYYFCSPRTHRAITYGLATRADADVFSLDYRLAPEHPFPAALDDALAAYRRLLADGVRADSLVIAGDSAGGGLALATLVALRDAGGALPAGALLYSPWTDLAVTGASIRENDGRDPMFCGDVFARVAAMYLGDANQTRATDPYVSPLYADYRGLPPLYMLAGSTETLLDDTRRVAQRARAAGVQVECNIARGLPHIWPIYAPFMPEARRSLDDSARFVQRVTTVDTTARAQKAASSSHAPQSPQSPQSSESSISS